MLTLGVLCSGALGFDTLTKLAKDYNVAFVLTDRNSTTIIQFTKKHNIPCFVGNPRGGKGYDFIKNIRVDVITSINYLFLIEEDIIEHPNQIAFNIHGSLLPKYRGRTPHVWAIINGEVSTGITAHKIEAGCDTGAIIHQIEIPIEDNDTGNDMLLKYKEQYFPIIDYVLRTIVDKKLTLIKQDESEATYFGKRTPLDGEIKWNWDSERIRNWVRAQAFPYPGAFTFYNGEKIIVDKVSVIDIKNTHQYSFGTIIQDTPKVVVKTRNGAVKLEQIRTENCTFTQGTKFENENRK